MAGITGLGGVFIKSIDPKALNDWYRDKLGLDIASWGGAMFDRDGPQTTLWNPFSADTTYFAPSTREVMINFAVDDLDAYLRDLEGRGVKIEGHMDDATGKFAWVLDPDGTKIELWQAL